MKKKYSKLDCRGISRCLGVTEESREVTDFILMRTDQQYIIDAQQRKEE